MSTALDHSGEAAGRRRHSNIINLVGSRPGVQQSGSAPPTASLGSLQQERLLIRAFHVLTLATLLWHSGCIFGTTPLQAADAARPISSSSSSSWNIMPTTLEYYVQVGLGAPDLGVLVAPIDTSTTANFGQTQLFAFNVTQGADRTSKLLGYMRGYTVQASYVSADQHGVEVEVLAYDDGSLNGTISLQGLINAGTNEIALVGGTGDFRGARGYGVVTFLNSTATLALFHHVLHFL